MNGGLFNMNDLDKEIVGEIIALVKKELLWAKTVIASPTHGTAKHYAHNYRNKLSRMIGWLERLS